MSDHISFCKKMQFSVLGTTSKKKSKLRDIGQLDNQFFSLIRKRENYLRGEGLNQKVPFYLGILLVNFEYFL